MNSFKPDLWPKSLRWAWVSPAWHDSEQHFPLTSEILNQQAIESFITEQGFCWWEIAMSSSWCCSCWWCLYSCSWMGTCKTDPSWYSSKEWWVLQVDLRLVPVTIVTVAASDSSIPSCWAFGFSQQWMVLTLKSVVDLLFSFWEWTVSARAPAASSELENDQACAEGYCFLQFAGTALMLFHSSAIKLS